MSYTVEPKNDGFDLVRLAEAKAKRERKAAKRVAEGRVSK